MTTADFLPELDQEMAKTREALSRLPDDGLGFRPHEKSWTAVELAAHIANVPTWITMTLATSEFDLAEPMEQPPAPTGASELLERFDEAVAVARKALSQASDEALAEPWSLRTGDDVMFTMPRAAVIRVMILNHMIHHRGQFTVYLRMLGAPVPSLYGPSADEM